MHQALVLGGHGEQDLLERVGVIVDQRENSAKVVDKVIKEASVDVRFDAVDENRQPTGKNRKGMSSGSCRCGWWCQRG